MVKLIYLIMSLSVYLPWHFGCNMALVIFPSKALGGMRYRHLCPSYHPKKAYQAKRPRKTFISGAGLLAFFSLDSWGGIFKCLFPRTIVNPNPPISRGKHEPKHTFARN